MAFWDKFIKELNPSPQYGTHLQQKLAKLLPQHPETGLVKITCFSGLLARVANIDFNITLDEIEKMKKVLANWFSFSTIELDAIVQITVSEIKELAGIDNHKFCHPLNELLSREEKTTLLEGLFAVAASDGTVSEAEVEEIRLIAKSLRLQHPEFISAKATVIAQLGSLKKT